MQADASDLKALIQQRLVDGADKTSIDAEIWRKFGQEWCVMFTDLVGFSRLVAEFGVIHFLQTIYESHRLLFPLVEKHHGHLLKTEGDSFMVIFRSPQDALACAVAMQDVLVDYNQHKPREEKVLLCVGLGYGDMLRVGTEDVFGAEVNAASKLGEESAKQGDILLTQAVKDALGQHHSYQFSQLAHTPSWLGAAYQLVR